MVTPNWSAEIAAAITVRGHKYPHAGEAAVGPRMARVYARECRQAQGNADRREAGEERPQVNYTILHARRARLL